MRRHDWIERGRELVSLEIEARTSGETAQAQQVYAKDLQTLLDLIPSVFGVALDQQKLLTWHRSKVESIPVYVIDLIPIVVPPEYQGYNPRLALLLGPGRYVPFENQNQFAKSLYAHSAHFENTGLLNRVLDGLKREPMPF